MSLVWNPIVPPWFWWAFAVVGVVVAVVEWRKSARWRSLRLVSIVVLWVALGGIFAQPRIPISQNQEILLLTSGYQPAQVEAALRKRPDWEIWRMPDAAPWPKVPEVSATFLATAGSRIGLVLGHGLSPAELELLPEANFLFEPAPRYGIVALTLPAEVYVNEGALIAGRLIAEGSTSGRVRLLGPEGAIDSMEVQPGNPEFQLQFRPRSPGQVLYSLEWSTAKGWAREEVPVTVQPTRMLRVLQLQDFPTPELKFLKQHLQEGGHRVMVRTQVSRGTFVVEAGDRVPDLSRGVPDSVDVVMVTEGVWSGLSSGERRALLTAAQEGCGVLLFPEEVAGKRPVLGNLNLIVSRKDSLVLPTSAGSEKVAVLAMEPIDDGTALRKWKPLFGGSLQLGAYRMWGQGRVAYLGLKETYPWRLAGKTELYGEVWSRALRKIARRQSDPELVMHPHLPVFKGDPLTVRLIGNGVERPVLLNDSVTIPLREEVALDDVYEGRTWAGKPGWHRWSVGAVSVPYYVSPAGAWPTLVAAQRQVATQIRASATRSGGVPDQSYQEFTWIFVVLVLLACGVLWLVPKL